MDVGVPDHKEGWALKNCGAFELCCWFLRFLRVPWTTRRSSQSILKEITPEYSLEELIRKLKLQYFGHLMQRVSSLEKTLMLGKIEDRRRKGATEAEMVITDSMAMSLSNLWEIVRNREACRVHGIAKSETDDWTTKWPPWRERGESLS